ncbi:hypothetical protein PF005_g26137 [Phytophthora fragariae]|uniref:Uncharacterized protein n=1 Tax=Phytophthora fragariae TaxID=53985 RepID=A0A6A3QH12_9STRA|nr:hypothetical protein PF003_g29140 [Phytophthora fragariae]KAE8925484.1 hypothetical protein PF009_g24308 [Phytophthora fragariae]KAE8962622.1 hypothetical protein PF011_g29315 [Phytophthora fragariae]KAE9061339.1 hypothetical protein PF010_g29854 [Phytophthora fragariae]KAE9076129.1 hypothetical protein PF007_g24745 [Phytophthora fragariae]
MLVGLYWNRRSAKPLRKVISDPSELEEAVEGDKEIVEEATGICYQAEYDISTDDDDDEEALLSSDNADAEGDDNHNEQASQERVDARSNRENRFQQMNHCLDYSYEYLGTEV